MSDQWIEKLKTYLLHYFTDADVRIYLFGSQARKTAKESSDIDVAIDGNGQDLSYALAILREQMEESPFPYHVDIVDMSRAGSALCQRIREEGIVWKDFRNGLN